MDMPEGAEDISDIMHNAALCLIAAYTGAELTSSILGAKRTYAYETPLPLKIGHVGYVGPSLSNRISLHL